jgi:hypothetical protein
MAKPVGKELPEDAFALLRPGGMEQKRGKVVQVITVNPAGWADAAMLSYADIVAMDRNRLRLATWGDGECARNLRQNGKATLLVVDRDLAYYIKSRAAEISEREKITDINQDGGDSPLAFFNMAVEEVKEDRVPTARVLSGVTFEGSESEDKAHREIFKLLTQK